MEDIHMYTIHPRIVRPFPCIHRTCGIYFHPSMTIGNFYHNPHFHVDGLVVLQILPNLDPHIGRSVAWIEGIPVYVLHPMLVCPIPSTLKVCGMYVNPSMATDPSITTHTSLGMAWWFTNPEKP